MHALVASCDVINARTGMRGSSAKKTNAPAAARRAQDGAGAARSKNVTDVAHLWVRRSYALDVLAVSMRECDGLPIPRSSLLRKSEMSAPRLDAPCAGATRHPFLVRG
jgi:hypothetical protein